MISDKEEVSMELREALRVLSEHELMVRLDFDMRLLDRVAVLIATDKETGHRYHLPLSVRESTTSQK